MYRFSLFLRSTVVIAVWRVVHNITTITSKECWAECCRRAKSVRGTILHCGNRWLVPARTRWHQTRICDVRSSSTMSSLSLSTSSIFGDLRSTISDMRYIKPESRKSQSTRVKNRSPQEESPVFINFTSGPRKGKILPVNNSMKEVFLFL